MSRLDEVVQESHTQGLGLISTLHAVQKLEGHVSPEAIRTIAKTLGLTESTVMGVITFYSDIHLEKPGQHNVKICLGDSCYARQSQKVVDAACSFLKAKPGETTADGKITVGIAYCLGNCALSPSMLVDEDVYGRLTPSSVKEVLKEVRRG